MSNDRQIVSYLSPADLVGLMNQTGVIAVHESGNSDGKPVIHAAVKVMNAQTGEQLPGGLPFSVVMFKSANEPGYSNIAIGTIVPASELNVALPRDYFNFCNQRFRFTRTFPLDERSFVIQMDLVLRNATREYIKFSFGLWSALFAQMLFELLGRGRESLIAAAEAYAQVHTDFAEQVATTPAAQEMPAEPEPMALDADAIVPVSPVEAEAPVAEAEVSPAAADELPADAIPEAISLEPDAEDVHADALAEEPAIDQLAEESMQGVDVPSEHVEIVADPAEGKDIEATVAASELSIVAGPAGAPLDEPAIEPAEAVPVDGAPEPVAEQAMGEAEAKDVMPA